MQQPLHCTSTQWNATKQQKCNNRSHNNLDESMLSERVHKGYTLCDSIFVAFWKMENYEELISGCQGLSSGEVLDYRSGEAGGRSFHPEEMESH